MRVRVNRALVEDLLRDTDLSYREIARRANCSDFSVRAISQKLADAQHDGPPNAAISEPLTVYEWCVVGAVAVAIFGGIWLLAQQRPPPDGSAM